MAIGVYFNPAAMDAANYDKTIKKLEEAGVGSPKGRLYHVCFGPSDHLMVFDIWDSQANFDAFGQKLMPILQEVGIDPGEPMVEQVHNIIQ